MNLIGNEMNYFKKKMSMKLRSIFHIEQRRAVKMMEGINYLHQLNTGMAE